jgi:hypothetical protein
VPEYLLHKGFEVDEEIWSTQEAAKNQVPYISGAN